MANSDEPKNFTNLFGKQKEAEEESEAPTGEEEDTGAQVVPIVKLQEVAVATGEEDEDVLLDMIAKLYRFDKEGKQWKERGAGTVKLLKHKKTSKVRLVMRQSETLKICTNHLEVPSILVQEHAGNDKLRVWYALNYADGQLKEELFCICFATVENELSTALIMNITFNNFTFVMVLCLFALSVLNVKCGSSFVIS